MSDVDAQSRPGRPKSAAKHDAIVEAARRMFTAEPYERVSLDAVATQAGVSKVTIYSHFPNKEALFIAAIGAGCESVFRKVDLKMGAAAADDDLSDLLVQLGCEFVEMIFDPEAERLHAVILAEGPRHPELPELFYESVVRRSTQIFAEFLGAQAAQGRLRLKDPYRAATQFLAIVQGEFRYRVELGLPQADRREVEPYVRDCVDTLLRSWRP